MSLDFSVLGVHLKPPSQNSSLSLSLIGTFVEALLSSKFRVLPRTDSSAAGTFDNVRRAFDNVRRAFDNVHRAFDNVRRASDNARRASDNARRASDNVRRASDNVRRASDNVRRASDNVRRAFITAFTNDIAVKYCHFDSRVVPATGPDFVSCIFVSFLPYITLDVSHVFCACLPERIFLDTECYRLSRHKFAVF